MELMGEKRSSKRRKNGRGAALRFPGSEIARVPLAALGRRLGHPVGWAGLGVVAGRGTGLGRCSAQVLAGGGRLGRRMQRRGALQGQGVTRG